MKNLTKRDLFAAALCLGAVIPGALVYGRLPDRMVTNWDIRFAENGTMPKAVVVFVMPAVFAAILLLCCLYANRLAAKQNAGKLSGLAHIFFPLLLFLTQGMMLLYALGLMKNVRMVVCLTAAASMLVLGNYLPKIRKNWIIGIRTPHTLMNEETWYKTHRFAGYLVTAGGAAALIATLFGAFFPALVILIASVLIPAVYAEVSFYLNKRKL